MKKNKIYPQMFIVAPLLLYIVFFLFPSLVGVLYSFTDWNSRSQLNGLNLVGLKNYVEIFTSNRDYSLGVINTLKFTLISNVLKLIAAFFLALLLQEGVFGKGFYRTVLYLPAVIPFVIIGLIFKSVFNYNYGLLNVLLENAHLGFLKQKWLSDLNMVWKSIYGVDAWRGIGYVMTIFLAGLNTIPKTYYDAAKIDGANFWHKLCHVTLPMMRGAIMINLVFGITYGLKVFDIVYVLTNGGPGHKTEVLTTFAFQLYSKGQYGMATAMNAILFVITAAAGVLVVKVMSKQEVEQ